MNTVNILKKLFIFLSFLLLTNNLIKAQVSICTGDSVVIRLMSSYTGTLQWQESLNQISWSNIIGATADSIKVFPINNTYYRVAISNGTCQQVFSDTSSVIINTIPVVPTASTHTPSQTQIIWNWNTVSGATGYQWDTTNIYPGTGVNTVASPTFTQTGLTCNTAYTLYVWAYNACGNSTSYTTLTQTTSACSGSCTTDTWAATSIGANCPSGRYCNTAVWTGTEMIVWGGGINGSPWVANTGGRYNPVTDTWTVTSTGASCPSARYEHTAVWTGTEMIIWGGNYSNTGGKYNPLTDTWTTTSTGANCPSGRGGYTAIWTGTEMIIWGGVDNGYTPISFNDGGRYNPVTDTWTATSTGANCPSSRSYHTAVWTGTEMVVWGGDNGVNTNTGGKYNPSTNTWTATSLTNAPVARYGHTAVWTGSEMIVWSGHGGYYLNSGGRYNPSTDIWTATSTGANCPYGRHWHTAVWSPACSEMIVWGGYDGNTYNDGGKYNPTTDTWTAISTGANCPSGRYRHTAVWAGNMMIVWGGGNYLNTGGRYTP